MIITIDIGNSKQDLAVFDQQENFIKKYDLQDIDLALKDFPDSKIIVSSVDDSYLSTIPIEFTLVRDFFAKDSFLDMPLKYARTIGDDRLATSYYLFKLNQQTKVLIDSGSFTTLDFISSHGHLGGYILPGEKALRASYKQGQQLKGITLNDDLNSKPSLPLSSQEAIEQGLLASLFFPIKGLIKQNRVDNLFVTGGNGTKVLEFFKSSKEDFKIQFAQDLLHRSLCYIGKRKLV